MVLYYLTKLFFTKSKLLLIKNLVRFFKTFYVEQEYIAKTTCQLDKFNRSWSILGDV